MYHILESHWLSTFYNTDDTSMNVHLLWCCTPPVQVCAPHNPCGRSERPLLSQSLNSGQPSELPSCTAGRGFPTFQKGACGPWWWQSHNENQSIVAFSHIMVMEIDNVWPDEDWTHLFFSKALKFFLNEGLIWFIRSTKSWLRTLGFAGFGLKL